MNETKRDEIPETEFGIIQYMRYTEKQIKDNQLHIGRLKTRLEWCEEKLDKINPDWRNSPQG